MRRRARRLEQCQHAGYEVVRLPMRNGHATGEYEDFLTGFVTADGQVWGGRQVTERGETKHLVQEGQR
jgi:glucose/arabinose dehydrogenase